MDATTRTHHRQRSAEATAARIEINRPDRRHELDPEAIAAEGRALAMERALNYDGNGKAITDLCAPLSGDAILALVQRLHSLVYHAHREGVEAGVARALAHAPVNGSAQ